MLPLHQKYEDHMLHITFTSINNQLKLTRTKNNQSICFLRCCGSEVLSCTRERRCVKVLWEQTIMRLHFCAWQPVMAFESATAENNVSFILLNIMKNYL